MNRRRFLLNLALCAGAAAWRPLPSWSATPLRLSGPALAETLPLLDMVRSQSLHASGVRTAFVPWNSPDQLRVLAAGGDIDGVVVSLATAAVLSNRGVPVRVLNLGSPPLWIVSSDNLLRSLADLAGEPLLVPFGRGETPDLLLRALAEKAGLSLDIRHAGGALEVLNQLLLGRVRHAFLSEPAATLAIRRSQTAREQGRGLGKRIDIRQSWAEVFPDHPSLTPSAFVMVGPLSHDRSLCTALAAAYTEAVRRVTSDPHAAATDAAPLFPALAAQVVDGSIPGSDIRQVSGSGAREAALFYLQLLWQRSPESVGGAMPGPSFLDTLV